MYELWSAFCAAIITSGVVMADGDCNQYGFSTTQPGKSCRDIYQLNPASRNNSGYYIVKSDDISFVYCDMTLECGGEKGWMRIADVNPAEQGCPKGWKKITSPVAACRSPSDGPGCFSAKFSTHKIPYSRICGKVIGIQKGTPDGYFPGTNTEHSIDQPYLDGISITYGNPRKHIWSYGAGLTEDATQDVFKPLTCPCSKHRGTFPLSFVRDHYYCESGMSAGELNPGTYFTADPLWDGQGCGKQNTCCVDPSLPWFFRQLPLANNNDVEARICYDQYYNDESVLVKEAQLFVQ